MANDPLGLSPDPTATDPQSSDYLGRMVPLAFKGQPALPVTGAAAVGSPSAPLNTGGGGSVLTGTGGGAIAGGGGFLDLARRLLNSGVDLSKLFGGGTDLGTRGETGGVSLSDYLRSLQAEDPSSQVSGGELALGAGEAGSEVGTQAATEGLGMLDNSLSLLENFGGFSGLGLTTAELLPIIESFFGKDISLPFSGEGRGAAQLHDTKGVRRDFAGAFPVLKGAASTFERFAGLDKLSREDQIKELQGIAEEGGLQLGKIAPVSQFTSTEGGRQSGGGTSIHIDPLNVSGIEKQTPALYMDAYLNSLIANDKLAQLGVPFPTDTTGTTYRNPLGELGPGGVLYQLAQEAGVNPNQFLPQQSTDPFATNAEISPAAAFQLTPEETAAFSTPGQLLPTIQSIFSRLNPNFAASPLGQRLAAFGSAPQDGTAPEGGTGAGPLTAPFTPFPGAEPTGAGPLTAPFTPLAGSDQGDTLTAPLTAPFTPLPGTSGFGNLANAAMSQGGGGADLAKEQLGSPLLTDADRIPLGAA